MGSLKAQWPGLCLRPPKTHRCLCERRERVPFCGARLDGPRATTHSATSSRVGRLLTCAVARGRDTGPYRAGSCDQWTGPDMHAQRIGKRRHRSCRKTGCRPSRMVARPGSALQIHDEKCACMRSWNVPIASLQAPWDLAGEWVKKPRSKVRARLKESVWDSACVSAQVQPDVLFPVREYCALEYLAFPPRAMSWGDSALRPS